MKSEITIQNHLSSNIPIQWGYQPINDTQYLMRTLQKTRCGYRELLFKGKNIYCSYRYKLQKIEDTNSQQSSALQQLIALFQNSLKQLTYLSFQSQSENEDTTQEPYKMPSQKKRLISKKKEQKQQLLQDPTALILYNEYRKHCSSNLMKNIKEGFIKSVVSSNDTEKIEKMTEYNMKYSQIKRKLIHLKSLSSENKAIKIICKHQYINILFKDFLEKMEDEWLIQSKIKQKEQCLNLSKFLLKLLGLQEYLNVIEDYKK